MTIQLDRRSLLVGAGVTATTIALAGCATSAGGGVSGLPSASPTTVGMNANLTDAINAMMDGHIKAGRITGGVTAVARRNKLVHMSPHGMFELAKGTPMPADGIFRMMSSTKPVTGVAILQQMEQGKLKLEDPVSKYIPELTNMKVWKAGAREARARTDRSPPKPEELEPAKREITLKDLATHTSGLNGSARGGGLEGGGRTLASYIPLLKDTPLDFQPGTRWAYSATTGPDVLARVVEITSGKSYDVYLKDHIFDPIGMNDTRHNLNAEQMTRRVPRYAKQGAGANLAGEGGGSAGTGEWRVAEGSASPAKTTYFAGAYALNGSAKDYLLFESMLLNEGRAVSGARVLKPESVKLMRTNLVGDLYKGIGNTTKGTDFGVLVRIVREEATCGCSRAVGAFGWGGAYGTMSWTDPARELVAVLMIQQSVGEVQRDFERVIQDAMTV